MNFFVLLLIWFWGLFGFMLVTVFCVPLCVCSVCELYVFHMFCDLLIFSVDSGFSFQAV